MKKKYETKAEMMWKIGKEQEEEFRKKFSTIEDEETLDELFKLIRGTEYRRGKEDGRNEIIKEMKNEN